MTGAPLIGATQQRAGNAGPLLYFGHPQHRSIGILLAECPAAVSEAPRKLEEAKYVNTIFTALGES